MAEDRQVDDANRAEWIRRAEETKRAAELLIEQIDWLIAHTNRRTAPENVTPWNPFEAPSTEN